MRRFSKVSERQITNAIVKNFSEDLLEHTKTDVIVVGGGPSGLMCGRDLAKEGMKVLIIEANNYLGGGFWVGGYLMSPVTFRAPAEEVLEELNIPFKEADKGLFVSDGPNACSKLISAACDAGVKILNLTKFDDCVYRNGRVEGVVVNWSPVSSMPRQITCVDPVSLESKIVVDATGHDACVAASLEKRHLLEIKGYGAMWVEASEDVLVEKTGFIHPGLIAAGMSVSTVFGIPRMGPTFGGMLFSGRKAAEVARKELIKVSEGSLQEEAIEVTKAL